MSRLTPEFLGKNYVYGTGEMDAPHISLIKDRNKRNIRNEKSRGVTSMDISTPLNHNLRVNTTRIWV
jgi:hypothetical protein